MRRSSGGVSIGTRIYIVLLIFGLFMVITTAGDAITIFTKDKANLSEKKISEFQEGEMVNGKAEYVWDTIATLETSNTIYGIPYSKKSTPYYLVAVNMGTDDAYFVLMHVTNEDSITKMNGLMNSTQNMIMSDADTYYSSNLTPIGLNMKTVKVPSEVKQYLYEYFEESGSTRAECDELVADCVLEQIDYTKTKMQPIIGLAVIIIPTIIFIASKLKNKRSRTTYVNEIPSSQDMMNMYNTPPTPSNSTSANGAGSAKRYSAADYEKSSGYTPGEMDSINPDDYFK